jgi:hypothetical protein
MRPDSTVGFRFDIRHGAESASHASIILAAFALTIIILLLGSESLRRDKMSSFVIRPFLVAFVGNLFASFQFMIVQSDHKLDEKTFALLMPAEFLAVVATTLMLFGITLAVFRRYSTPEVRRLAVWLFASAGLYSIGVLHFGIDALMHAHAEHYNFPIGLHLTVGLGVWGPILLLIPLELMVQRLRITPVRLHSVVLWLVTSVVGIALLAFGVGSFMKPYDPRDHVILPLAAFAIILTQWLVLGSCLSLLLHFKQLEILFPVPEGDMREESEIPEIPI